MTQLISFDINLHLRNLDAVTRRVNATVADTQRAVRRTNQRSLEWMQQRAAKELDQAISRHGRSQEFNSGRLMRAIEDPASHEVTDAGFQFMVDAKVRPSVPYYRAIERGSSHMVGRVMPFMFITDKGTRLGPSTSRRAETSRKAGKMGVDPVMGRARPSRTDAIIGPRQFKRMPFTNPVHEVVIRNPVPRYAYGRNAARTFIRQGLYKRFLRAEIEAMANRS